MYSDKEIAKIRKACALVAECLDHIADFVAPNISTKELNDICASYITSRGGISAALNYHGYPESVCTSVNNVVCHGIPSASHILKKGDIINIDIALHIDGFYGDSSRMFKVGSVSKQAEMLMQSAFNSMHAGIEAVKPGNFLGDIGYAIQSCAESSGYSVVKDFCGHGIGNALHLPPNILNYGQRGAGQEIIEGMVFTIEPMVNIGMDAVKTLSDGWTVVTKDSSLSAQFEHTIQVTKTGYEILTISQK